jgi:hypothetical protein
MRRGRTIFMTWNFCRIVPDYLQKVRRLIMKGQRYAYLIETEFGRRLSLVSFRPQNGQIPVITAHSSIQIPLRGAFDNVGFLQEFRIPRREKITPSIQFSITRLACEARTKPAIICS